MQVDYGKTYLGLLVNERIQGLYKVRVQKLSVANIAQDFLIPAN